MQYRVAAAYQNNAWEKGNTLLLELFEKVKEEECARRMNLREFLVAFTQRQQRLLHSLPATQNDVMEALVGKNMTMEETRDNVQAIIGNEPNEEDSLDSSEGAMPDEDLLNQSPLESDLLSKSKVLYSRTGNNTSTGWRASLVVMTSDSYLHIFDLNKGKSTKIGADPLLAFESLLPDVVLPTTENVTAGKANFCSGWCDSFIPCESLVLGNCTIRTKDERTFELVETVVTKGMFGKTGSKKVQLRTPTKAEADDWIAILTAR